jgi:L-ascorbate metabolism protein UlaG (beta-lactamase superfamily)
VLLELDGFRVLTDPVFGDRASPLTFAGPKRFHPVPATIDELPEVDVVVLSHDHYDHLCRTTMAALAKKSVPIVTSLGVGAHLEAMGIAHERITELDWNESVEIKGLKLTATPCQHFSGRGVADRNSTLWSSWVIQSANRKVFFSGDVQREADDQRSASAPQQQGRSLQRRRVVVEGVSAHVREQVAREVTDDEDAQAKPGERHHDLRAD